MAILQHRSIPKISPIPNLAKKRKQKKYNTSPKSNNALGFNNIKTETKNLCIQLILF